MVGSATLGRKVVAVTDGSLLTSGVTSVLCEHAGINVVMVNRTGGQVYRRIREARPDVVIIADGGADADQPERGLSVAERGLSVQRLLQDNPRSTVIALSLGRPEMEVFRARRVSEATVEDLLQALEGARRKATGRRPSRHVPVSATRGANRPRRREGP